MSRILHPTDFSKNSAPALKHAGAFAKHFGAELHLLYVIQDSFVMANPPLAGFIPQEYRDEIRNQLKLELDKLVTDTDIVVVSKVVKGSTFVEIIRYARENSIDLIVMGTHGRTGLMNLLIGSVAENVVRKSHTPVMTIHPEDHEFVIP